MYINSKGGSVIAGNATKDPEYKLVGDKQTPLFKLSIVIGRDEQDSVMYADIAAWSKLAEYLNGCGIRKGDPLAAFGTWSKREVREKVYWTFNADFVSVLGKITTPGYTQSGEPGGSTEEQYFGEMPDFMKT